MIFSLHGVSGTGESVRGLVQSVKLNQAAFVRSANSAITLGGIRQAFPGSFSML